MADARDLARVRVEGVRDDLYLCALELRQSPEPGLDAVGRDRFR